MPSHGLVKPGLLLAIQKSWRMSILRGLRVPLSRHIHLVWWMWYKYEGLPCLIDRHAHFIPLSITTFHSQSGQSCTLVSVRDGSRSKETGRCGGCRTSLHVSMQQVANNTDDQIRHGLPLPLVYSWPLAECCLDMIQERYPEFWQCPW